MSIADKYINGLKQAYFDNNAKEEWEHFESVKYGASKEDIDKLKELYPDIPEALIKLLEFVDGTYHREYSGENLSFFFFGSDVDEGQYPYYLFSSAQIVEQEKLEYHKNFADLFYYYLEDEDAVNELGLFVDERIKMDGTQLKWLCFSDCMNNGGTSSLFIDFSPSEKGISGQIVRFLHDPDELRVLADSFDEYLQMLIDNGFSFISEDTVG